MFVCVCVCAPVLSLIYWRDVKLSALVLGVELVVLLTLSLNTLLHTIVLFLLSFLVVSLTYIVSKIVIDSFYNREVKNPFSDYLNKKISLPEDKVCVCVCVYGVCCLVTQVSKAHIFRAGDRGVTR